MASSNDPKVTRRETLKLATAVGALGAGLGVTLGEGTAVAGYDRKEVGLKDVITEKVGLGAADVGTVSLKISYHKADGTTQLLHAFDLTSYFVKLDPATSLNFTMENIKGPTNTTLLNRNVYVKLQKF